MQEEINCDVTVRFNDHKKMDEHQDKLKDLSQSYKRLDALSNPDELRKTAHEVIRIHDNVDLTINISNIHVHFCCKR